MPSHLYSFFCVSEKAGLTAETKLETPCFKKILPMSWGRRNDNVIPKVSIQLNRTWLF